MSHAGSTIDSPQVIAAAVSVNAGAATPVADAVNQYGMRYAKVEIACNKAHSLRCFGSDSKITAVASAVEIMDGAKAGLSADSGKAGSIHYIPTAGLRHFCPQVTNNDGAVAATVSIKVTFFNA